MVAPDDTVELPALDEKLNPVDEDLMVVADSESLPVADKLKKLSLVNLKNFIGTGNVIDFVPLFSAIDEDAFLEDSSSKAYPLSGSIPDGSTGGDNAVSQFIPIAGTYRNFSVKMGLINNLTGTIEVVFKVNSATVRTITLDGSSTGVVVADDTTPIQILKGDEVNYAILVPFGQGGLVKLAGISCTVDVAGVSGITSLNGEGTAAQTLTGGDGIDVSSVSPDHDFAVDATVVRTTGAQTVSNKELINITKIDYSLGANNITSGTLSALFTPYVEVGGEGGVSDDLDTIPAGTNGQYLILRAEPGTGTITVTSNGNIKLIGDNPFLMNDAADNFMALLFDGVDWVEQYRNSIPTTQNASFTWAASDEDSAVIDGLQYTTEAADSDKPISKIVLSLKNTPTGNAVVVDILQEDAADSNVFVSIFSVLPSIPTAKFSSSTSSGISATTWLAGRRLQIVIDTDDANDAATGLKVTIA